MLTPLPAASVVVLREPYEVLMILRHENSSFVPSAWVFPGGAVDSGDGPPEDVETFRRAAIREVEEETGIHLTGELVATSRWITPAGMPRRFDTMFFLARAPQDAVVKLQEQEAIDHQWIEPSAALERHKTGEFPMVFPTIRNLEAIAPFRSIDELLDARRGAKIEPVEPRLVVEGSRRRIVLP
jgi:8-oxo-dGTP pyrophosphatase MutT (NUDIX family)